MKKALFVLIVFFISKISFCQDDTDRSPDSIVHKSGFVFKSGEKIKLGTGTMPDGSFKFIRINAASMWSYSGNTPNSANNANALPPSYNGLNAEISKLQRRGSKKMGFVSYAILKVGAMQRYEVDLESAISAGEIQIPGYNPKSSATTLSTSSLADELAKLKKLMDDGILSKEEFDAAKKKLLDKKD